MKPTTLIAASSEKTRRAIARALSGFPHADASNADEVLLRITEDERPLLLIWDMETGGEFDRDLLKAVRATRPLLPIVAINASSSPGRKTLRLNGLTLVFRPFEDQVLTGEVERLIAKARTEQPRADLEVLRLALRRLTSARTIFERLPVAATLTDARGRVLDVNREALALTGRRPNVGAGQTCRAYWDCRITQAHCPLQRALATGRTVYHARVRSDSTNGERTSIERISTFRLPGVGRRALIVTGPATTYFRRLRRLRQDASLDHLTAVCNRGRFDALTSRARRNERRGRTSAFLMMDVDGLKLVNDRFGHAAGDRLLQRMGTVLSENTQRGDIVGRVGGDEFAIYCPDSSPLHARNLVGRLRRAITESNTRHPLEARLSVEFGVACSTGRRTQDLRKQADAALYRRKRRAKRTAVSGLALGDGPTCHL